MASSKLEFAVEKIKDRDGLEDRLKKEPGFSKAVVMKNDSVVIETALPCDRVGEILQEMTGSRAVLQGFGEGVSAVAMMEGCMGRGVVRLTAANTGEAGLVDGTIDGLPAGDHVLQVHVSGDISQGCDSLGPMWGSSLGKITAESNGRASFKFIIPGLKISEIVGRSLAVSKEDNQKRLACGIIARSAGLFQNSKKLCACDGVTVWDERNVPLAGSARKQNYHDHHNKL